MDVDNDLLEMNLDVGDGDWTPTPHGQHLGHVLATQSHFVGKDVLELGAGVANHTIIMLRRGVKSLVATEITEPRCRTAQLNVERNCGEGQPIEYRVADWLSTEGQFDIVVTNPPFARSGQRNRRYFIDSLILDSHKRLRPGGELLFVQSSMADLAKTQRRMEENGFEVDFVASTQGPFRDYYFEDESFMEEIRQVPNGFEERDGTLYETLTVVHGKLKPWSPPAGSH